MYKRMFLLGLAFLATSISSLAEEYKRDPNSAVAHEVRFLSVDLRLDGLGSVVARPCDESVGCDLLYARIDTNTKLSQNERILTSREARKLNWHSGVLAINERGTAVSIRLFGRRP